MSKSILQVREEIEAGLATDHLTLETANSLEVMLDENFPHDDFMQETVEILAMFRPGGGEWLFDETYVRSRLKHTIFYLERLARH